METSQKEQNQDKEMENILLFSGVVIITLLYLWTLLIGDKSSLAFLIGDLILCTYAIFKLNKDKKDEEKSRY